MKKPEVLLLFAGILAATLLVVVAIIRSNQTIAAAVSDNGLTDNITKEMCPSEIRLPGECAVKLDEETLQQSNSISLIGLGQYSWKYAEVYSDSPTAKLTGFPLGLPQDQKVVIVDGQGTNHLVMALYGDGVSVGVMANDDAGFPVNIKVYYYQGIP